MKNLLNSKYFGGDFIKEITFVCPSCSLDFENHGKSGCEMQFEVIDNNLSYDYKRLLFKALGKRFLLNQVLNNNAKLIYQDDPIRSLAFPGNHSERNSFIKTQIDAHYVLKKRDIGLLDVGCGPLKIPEYLLGLQEKIILYGIDPLSNPNFAGFKIDGCAEFIPVEENSLDFVIFAGSLDQTVSVSRSLSEAVRVLNPDGVILIRLNDDGSFFNLVVKVLRNWKHTLFSLISKKYYSRYLIYDYNLILYRPFGAIDPFHHWHVNKYQVLRIMKKLGFLEVSNEVIEGSRIILFKRV